MYTITTPQPTYFTTTTLRPTTFSTCGVLRNSCSFRAVTCRSRFLTLSVRARTSSEVISSKNAIPPSIQAAIQAAMAGNRDDRPPGKLECWWKTMLFVGVLVSAIVSNNIKQLGLPNTFPLRPDFPTHLTDIVETRPLPLPDPVQKTVSVSLKKEKDTDMPGEAPS